MGVLGVIDADTHLTEPVDLWTARLPARFRDRAPRVELHEPSGMLRWRIGDRWCSRVGNYSLAGWPEFPPSCPPTLEDANPAAYDAVARLAHMDAVGVEAQVLYPNVIAFEGHAFLALDDEELRLACVRTYNDYQSEFASIAPERFVLLTMLPFWDVAESVDELRRCHAMGHRGVLWAAQLEKHGFPDFPDEHWDLIYAAAQELGLSINFHVGVGNTQEEIEQAMHGQGFDPAYNAARATMALIGNTRTLTTLLTCGLLDRFPSLDFVSVESGFGYIPYLLDSLDWTWKNGGAVERYPDRMLPSEYFFRQVYAMFWFEQEALPLLAKYQDNVMFETDFPHPTCLHAGPGTYAPMPGEVIARDTAIVGDDVMRKVLHDNAARVYHVG
ncbi:MAG TPA: amidohydrolase family protein [Gaiellaceae bacterium]|nr:amidohydrolase family protein [Gaiellaceae bacterium]